MATRSAWPIKAEHPAELPPPLDTQLTELLVRGEQLLQLITVSADDSAPRRGAWARTRGTQVLALTDQRLIVGVQAVPRGEAPWVALPYAAIVAWELSVTLLYGRLDLWGEQDGAIVRTSIEFNMVGLPMIEAALAPLERHTLGNSRQDAPRARRQLSIDIGLPFKFGNFLHDALLPGEAIRCWPWARARRMRAAYQEKRRYAMRVVYTSDLHGHPEHYTQVLHLAAECGARSIILGGDLFPNSHAPRQGLILQRDFIHAVFEPWLRRIRTQFRALKVYVLLGNEDWASTADLLIDLAAAELFYPLHQRAWRINGGWLAGSSLVPITPFLAKDWDRLEGSEPEPPFPVGGGLRSRHGLLGPTSLTELRNLPTIAEELAQLTAQSEPARTIYIYHSPPYATRSTGSATGGRSAAGRCGRLLNGISRR